MEENTHGIDATASKKIDGLAKKQGSCNSELLQKVSALLEDDGEA